MPKYKIYWDIGFGKNEEIIDADTLQEAHNVSSDRWLEDEDRDPWLEESIHGAELITDEEEEVS